MLSRFIRVFGADLTNKPSDADFVEEAGEVYNYGFEMAHALRACGHSVGDYRDAGYIPGKPETYTASEKCIGCEREAKLAVAQASERELRELVVKWREAAEQMSVSGKDAWQLAKRECAEELERILAREGHRGLA